MDPKKRVGGDGVLVGQHGLLEAFEYDLHVLGERGSDASKGEGI